jgi:hypothetical protein
LKRVYEGTTIERVKRKTAKLTKIKTSTHLVLTYSQPRVNLGSDARNTAATTTPTEKTKAPTRKFN